MKEIKGSFKYRYRTSKHDVDATINWVWDTDLKNIVIGDLPTPIPCTRFNEIYNMANVEFQNIINTREGDTLEDRVLKLEAKLDYITKMITSNVNNLQWQIDDM